VSTSNKRNALARRLRRVESRNITYVAPDFPVFWESARGVRVFDQDKRAYLDLTAAFGVASLGHSHPVVQKAMLAQSRKLWHGMGDVHPSTVKIELMEALADITPGNLQKCILSSSGAEAVESALKTARLVTGKPGVLAFEGAYHGLTYGALAATHGEHFGGLFRDQMGRFVVHAPYPDATQRLTEEHCLEGVRQVLMRTPAIGAVLIEPMQARGGIRIPHPSFLREVQKIAKEHGVLLIADEIYTGFARTGKWFGVEHSRVVPDLMCLGKALANGYPISACIGPASIMDAWPESDGEAIHTSTFLGNPLGCAMGVAAIREMKRQKLADRTKTSGDFWLNQLREALKDVPSITDIRGTGLMIGIQLKDARQAGQTIVNALKRGLILLSGGPNRNVLTLTPPLTISKSEMTKATAILLELIS